MNNFAFCTLVYGEKYLKYSSSLIEDVTSRGADILIMTNNLDYYKCNHPENKKLYVLKSEKDYFSYNHKKDIARECLNKFSTCIFLDADVRIFELDNFDFLNDINEGLHIFNTFGDIGNTFLSEDISRCNSALSRNTKYGKMGLDFLNKNNLKYKKNYHGADFPDGYLEHFLEGKWILKKNEGKELIFLDLWDKLASFSEKIDIDLGYNNSIGAGEGAHMSIAAYNSNINLFIRQFDTYNIFNTKFISNYEQKISGEKPWNIVG